MSIHLFFGFFVHSHNNLELGESFLAARSLGNLDHIESDSLGKRSALSNGHYITLSDIPKAWAAVSGDVLVSLLKSVVFADVVKVIPAEDNGTLHLHFLDNSSEDTAADAHIAGEWALLVNVGTLNGLTWGLESQANVSVVTLLFHCLSRQQDLLLVEEYAGLLLERPLSLK